MTKRLTKNDTERAIAGRGLIKNDNLKGHPQTISQNDYKLRAFPNDVIAYDRESTHSTQCSCT